MKNKNEKRFISDWRGTNHFEIHDSTGQDYFVWNLDDCYQAYKDGRMNESMVQMLGEMMDLWCEKHNRGGHESANGT